MKKLILFALIFLIIAGCRKPDLYLPKAFDYSGLDYTKYLSKGFYMSHKSYPGENYDPIGLFSVLASPEISDKTVKMKEYDDWDGEVTKSMRIIRINSPRITEAIDSLYSFVKNKGANGLVELTIERERIPYDGEVMEFITITGFAIRIKKE